MENRRSFATVTVRTTPAAVSAESVWKTFLFAYAVASATNEILQPLNADRTLVLTEPIKHLFEQPRVVARDLEGKEQERLGVCDPVVTPVGVGEDAEL